MKQKLYIDFEFNQSQQTVPNLVSCSCRLDDGPVAEYWLHNSPSAQQKLATYLDSLRDSSALVAYAAVAECRCLLALGLDPGQFQIIDLFFEWSQLTFNNNSCSYGTYFANGYKCCSQPPSYNARLNKGKDNKEIGLSMGAAVAQLYQIDIDNVRKKEMRDLILQCKPEYSQQEQTDIMSYCSSDIQYLPQMLETLTKKLAVATKQETETVRGWQLERGKFAAAGAKMEAVGVPVLRGRIQNLVRSYDSATDSIIEDVNSLYPFYSKKKDRKSDFLSHWTATTAAFEEFLKSRGLDKTWPKTEKGAYSRDGDTLNSNLLIPEIKKLKKASDLINQLKWFRPDSEGDFFSYVGTDDRVRSYLGLFRTQTSRNAPKAKQFIFAMSSWLRCLIQPPEGYVIIGPDYSSQEFAIAAALSGDKAMKAAYDTGDPYLAFAKKAKAVPEAAIGKYCKSPAKYLADRWPGLKPDSWEDSGTASWVQEKHPEVWEQYGKYKLYKVQRDLFKATTLGLQFGLGVKNLALKLSLDMSRVVTEAEAQKLVRLHKSIFRTFWRWLDTVERQHKRQGYLLLEDGWALLSDIDNSLSIKNFRVQGNGAAIMRKAVIRAQALGLDVISPLHDAIYFICKESDLEKVQKLATECMEAGVRDILGDRIYIRVDMSVHMHGDDWIENKGYDYFQMLKQYLEYRESDDDILSRMQETVLRVA